MPEFRIATRHGARHRWAASPRAHGSRRSPGVGENMDTTSARKKVNTAKAALRKKRGPASTSQDAAPIADAMREFWEADRLAFGIPAHGGGRGPVPEFAQWAGMDAARY